MNIANPRSPFSFPFAVFNLFFVSIANHMMKIYHVGSKRKENFRKNVVIKSEAEDFFFK